MILLLPDFIGHPGCFQLLMQRLKSPFQTINYHSLPRTCTMPSMAEYIATRIPQPTWIIGYSFGGALGYEICQYFRDSPHLIMVDSHIPNSSQRQIPPEQQYQHWLTEDMQDWISLLQELNEVRLENILHHIHLFNRWQPRQKLQRAWWIRCRDNAMPSETNWNSLINHLCCFDTHAHHHEAIKNSDVISYLTQLIHKGVLP